MTQSPMHPADIESSRAVLISRIRDLGDEVDARRAGTARVLGGAAFLGLLGAGGLYDLWRGKGAVWAAVGVPESLFRPLVIAVASFSVILALIGVARHYYRDKGPEARLAALESELADLNDLAEP